MGFANNVVKVIESIASPQKDCTGHRIVDFLGWHDSNLPWKTSWPKTLLQLTRWWHSPNLMTMSGSRYATPKISDKKCHKLQGATLDVVMSLKKYQYPPQLPSFIKNWNFPLKLKLGSFIPCYFYLATEFQLCHGQLQCPRGIRGGGLKWCQLYQVHIFHEPVGEWCLGNL